MTKLREDIRAAVVCAAFAKENRTADNEINWNFVDSDVCIEFGNYFGLIGEVINELAEEIDTAKINAVTDKLSKLIKDFTPKQEVFA